MNMLDLMNKMTQLSEAKEKTKTGLKHTAEPGGYGRKDDEDDEGHKVKATAVKKGKGRPKKDADDSGETKKYDFSAFGVKSGKDVKLPKHDKKKTTVVKGKSQSHADNKKDDGTDPGEEPKTKAKKKGLKEYFDALDRAIMNEAEQIQIKPASQMPKQPGQMTQSGQQQMAGQKPAVPGQPQQTTGQSQQNAQVITQGNRTLGTVKNPALAAQIKKELEGGGMTLMPEGEMEETVEEGNEKWIQGAIKHPGAFTKKAKSHDMSTSAFASKVLANKDDYPAKTEKQAVLAKTLSKLKEVEQPTMDNQTAMGANLGAGRSQTTLEGRTKADNKAEKAGKKVTKDLEYDMYHKGKDDNKAEKAGKKVTKDIEYDEKKKTNEAKKPDVNPKDGIPDYAQDGKGKNDLKKKKVKEGMEHKLKAARHMGKAHALTKESYNCKYDDMEEARHYHEGYKEGLDECYGQMPIQGYVGEANNEVADMASYGAHTPTMEDEMDEGNAFTDKLRKTPAGGKFSVGGNTYTDRSSIEESPFAFEAWEKELNSILEGKDVTEGMTVSISKGQQGSPDSVSVSAQDGEADQLLSIIKSAGLGLFGGDDAGHSHTGQPMTVDVDGGEGPQAEIEVVDDHDDMLSLIRKMTGQGPAQSNGDYEEEGGHEGHGHEETCESCGSTMQEGHACGESIEEDEIDEGEGNETMYQREYGVAEGEEVVNNNDEAEEEQSDATRDAALAAAAGQNFANTDAPIKEGGDGGEASDAGAEGVNIADVAGETEEDLEESLANGADDTFEADIDFMTKVITDGLNGQKSTGQTTIPVVSTQVNRLGSPMKESTDLLTDWRKLSGIK